MTGTCRKQSASRPGPLLRRPCALNPPRPARPLFAPARAPSCLALPHPHTTHSLAVNVSGSFAAGQIYVALSRAKSAEGLYVTGFHGAHVKADAEVIAFYKRVAAAQAVASASAPAGRARVGAAAPASAALTAPVASQAALPATRPCAEAATGSSAPPPARQVRSGAAPAAAIGVAMSPPPPARSFASQRPCSVGSAAESPPLPPPAASPARPPAVSPRAAPPPRRQQPPPPSSQRQGPWSLAEAFGYVHRASPAVAAASPSPLAASRKQEEAPKQLWRDFFRRAARRK